MDNRADWLEQKNEWVGLQTIGLVESVRETPNKTEHELRCFIAWIKPNAKQFAVAVRQHWAIENNLHWQLDVTFNEDKLRARMGYAAQNLSIMRRMVLNTLKLDNSKGSLKGKGKNVGWSPVYLEHLLSLLFNF